MTKHTLRTIALGLALAVGSGGLLQAAQAQTAETPATAQPAPGKSGPEHRHGPMMRHHARHMGGMGAIGQSPLAMLGHLQSKLDLTESQQKLWDGARNQSREVAKAMREQRAEGYQDLRTQLGAGPLDLRALSARRDAQRAAIQPRLDAARDAWLAAYDALDGKQKQIVTDAIKQRVERGARSHRQPRPERPAQG